MGCDRDESALIRELGSCKLNREKEKKGEMVSSETRGAGLGVAREGQRREAGPAEVAVAGAVRRGGGGAAGRAVVEGGWAVPGRGNVADGSGGRRGRRREGWRWEDGNRRRR